MPTVKAGYFNAKGDKVPSVTQVLGSLGFGKEALMYWAWKLGKEGKDFKAERGSAADVGTLVHARIEAFLRNQPPYEPNGPEETELWPASQNPFAGFLSWYDRNRFDLIAAEVPLVHEEYGYGGTLDAVGRTTEGEIVLYDWKTSGGIYGTNFMQAAAYKALWNHHNPDYPIERAVVLHIPQAEKPKATAYGIKRGEFLDLFELFLHTLSLHIAQGALEPARFKVKS